MASGKSAHQGPGGGGGGAAGTDLAGGNGYAGAAQLSWTPGALTRYNIVRLLLHVPSGGDTTGTVCTFFTTGSVSTVQLNYTGPSKAIGGGPKTGLLYLTMLSKAGTLLATSNALEFVNGKLLMVSMEISRSGSAISAVLRAISPGSPAEYTGSPISTSVAGTSIGAVTQVFINTGQLLSSTSLGHVVVQYDYESLTSLSVALEGYNDEPAARRFQRICAEEGIPVAITGNAGDTPNMGPQPDDTLLNILQQTEDLDRGLIYEPVGYLGLNYRTYTTMVNQSPSLIADYGAKHLSPPFQPVEDDALTRNDITVTRNGGSSYHISLGTGELSTQDPPNGVGTYNFSLSVNAAMDSELPAVAHQLLALGTVHDFRYPQITFDLTRSEVTGIFTQLIALIGASNESDAPIGNLIQVVNPPAFLTTISPVTISQLEYGYVITLSGRKFLMEFNCVPASPFRA
jgi:hypothetical protein